MICYAKAVLGPGAAAEVLSSTDAAPSTNVPPGVMKDPEKPARPSARFAPHASALKVAPHGGAPRGARCGPDDASSSRRDSITDRARRTVTSIRFRRSSGLDARGCACDKPPAHRRERNSCAKALSDEQTSYQHQRLSRRSSFKDKVAEAAKAVARTSENSPGADVDLISRAAITWTLHPHSVFRLYWDYLIVALMGFTSIVLPLDFAGFRFVLGDGWLWAAQAVNVLFLTDIALNFYTGYVDMENRVLVMDPELTRRHYLRTWFSVDLVSTIPFDLIWMLMNNSSNQLRWLFKCLRLLRMCRLLRLGRITARLQIKSGLTTAMKTAIKFILFIFLVSHWYCCLFFAISGGGGPDGEVNGQGSWLDAQGLLDSGAFDQYVASIYWSIATMSTIACLQRESNPQSPGPRIQSGGDEFAYRCRYGDVTPVTSGERVFTCLVMVTGTSVYAYGITAVVSVASGALQSEREFTRQKDELNRYMRHMEMPKELQVALREYFVHYQASMDTFNEAKMLQILSPELQARITSLVNAPLIRQVPFFRTAQERCISQIVLALRPHLYVPGEMIIYSGDVGSEMYIIKSGEVQVYLEVDSSGAVSSTALVTQVKELARLTKGNFFGEMAILSGPGRRGANIRAVVYSIVYSLHRDSMASILNDFPKVKASIENTASRRERMTRAASSANLAKGGEDSDFSDPGDDDAKPPAAASKKSAPDSTGTAGAPADAPAGRPMAKVDPVGRNAEKDDASSDTEEDVEPYRVSSCAVEGEAPAAVEPSPPPSPPAASIAQSPCEIARRLDEVQVPSAPPGPRLHAPSLAHGLTPFPSTRSPSLSAGGAARQQAAARAAFLAARAVSRVERWSGGTPRAWLVPFGATARRRQPLTREGPTFGFGGKVVHSRADLW